MLGADIDEAEEKAVNDFLDALRVIVYQQGTTSAAYEVTLNDQPIVDYAVQFSGADVYVSSDLLGETLYLNLEEDMQHFGELVYRQQLQIDALVQQLQQLGQRLPEAGSGAGAPRNLRDELPPHY